MKVEGRGRKGYKTKLSDKYNESCLEVCKMKTCKPAATPGKDVSDIDSEAPVP